MHVTSSGNDLRRYPRYEVEDVVVVTAEGVCQLGDLSEGGLSFKCLYLQNLPDTCTIDLLNTSGMHLHNVEVHKVWEVKNSQHDLTDLFSLTVGVKFKDLTPEQEAVLRLMIFSNQHAQA